MHYSRNMEGPKQARRRAVMQLIRADQIISGRHAVLPVLKSARKFLFILLNFEVKSAVYDLGALRLPEAAAH